ncbi:TadE/TadG family type IV pilus assembly protein [Variovorax paradoxus]|uniref:TadE/TadG family type IV pilus assembly protein n=1 Tax=Variovorax paradoxus TaxID=34073 RepID=UPI00285A5483|nr:pilus assembly protein [Variovorax paradoxus]MDR6450929.1 Flp pilus assembly protein TadG [Variovorax paradoxus]
MRITTPSSRAHIQKGAYAVEFALVFLIFFSVLYAIISLGIVLTLRLSLQNAAEDGARAALRYQDTLGKREIEAKNVAIAQSSGWAPTPPVVDAHICQIEGNICGPSRICSADWSQRCQVVVTVTTAGMRSVLPPLMNLAVPDQLTGRASMLLDGRAL